jgi:uncharacterized glyoxalase superfamily protein PhnB
MSSQSIYPVLCYRDAASALDWLGRAFGFEKKAVVAGDDGRIQHAELTFRGGSILIRGERPDEDYSAGAPPGGAELYVVVDDPDAHHKRAVEEKVEIACEPADMPYGSREYGARDLEGNVWSFGTYDPSR